MQDYPTWPQFDRPSISYRFRDSMQDAVEFATQKKQNLPVYFSCPHLGGLGIP